jgi:hypothetical protein
LGTALGKAVKNADGTWQRNYQYGTVVVNPSAKTAHIDLKSGQSTTPAVVPTVKPTATPIVQKPTATPIVQKPTATPIVQKPTATPIVQKPTATPALTLSAANSSTANESVPGISVPSAQTSGVASLPAQPVLEFSLLGLGIPAILAGVVYLLIRR